MKYIDFFTGRLNTSDQQFRGGDVNASPLSEQVKNGALSVIEVLIGEQNFITLVDTSELICMPPLALLGGESVDS